MNERNAKSRTSAVTGVVENSTATGVRIEGVWYTLPRDIETRPPDRGARIELTVTSRHFVTGLKILEPAPEPAEADRAAVRASVLRSAARFAGSHPQPLRSTEVLNLARDFEAWVYRPVVDDRGGGEQSATSPDRDQRVTRESSLSSVVEFLANKAEARAEHVVVLAESWERWLSRPRDERVVCESCGEPLSEATFADGTCRTVELLATYGRERVGRTLCQACFFLASGEPPADMQLTPGA